jgi:Eco57I restriction-modification methylase/TaqI-like C-terminal specificity domain
MNDVQARSLIHKTFTQPFDKVRFHDFISDLLNHIDESKAKLWNKTYVKDAFKPRVNRFERLATYTDPSGDKIDLLVVHLERESSLERARTSLRNFVADYLTTRGGKEAGLVAFVSPNEKQWRFSYIRMEYATVERDSGKIGVETRLSPARRLSYIVGEGESCHTAQTRFVDLLTDTDSDPSLFEIEKAFSVEAVTKEFFRRYAELFNKVNASLQMLSAKDKRIGEEFKRKEIRTADFAKKLMGQIVFLYFLQKKGWLGVEKGKDWGTGPRDFMSGLAGGRYGAHHNFFNDVLEPLFYDTLATDRGHNAWCNRFRCRIPFLNGGLFEPLGDYNWRKTDMILPNKLFTNTEHSDAGDIGTGILDVFDRYNFTVNEAEPLEKEVAIDPEMLGKVFENLIEENLRKGLGSYYTPREIVHYMCQESLINYLDTAINTGEESIVRTKPTQIKLLGDPEPEQALLKTTAKREILPRFDIETFVHLGDQISLYEAAEADYRIKMPKSIISNAKLIDEKLNDITVCDPAVGSGAFPVGMMSEIVRARSALTPYFNDVHERTPYHFKRHAIQNCLYGVDIDPGAVEIAKLRLWLSLVVDEEDVKQIKPLPNLFYKIVTGNSLLGVEKNLFNQQLFRRLEELKQRYFDEPDKARKDRYKQQIEETIHELTNGKEAFDFQIYFSEVFQQRGGFDVAIANPPYVRMELFKPIKSALRTNYPSVHAERADLYCYFYARGLQLLCAGGVLSFISSNKFFRAAYGEGLREFLANKTELRVLVDFGDLPVFDASAYPCIVITRNQGPSNAQLVWTLNVKTTAELALFPNLPWQMTEQRAFSNSSWRIESSESLGFLDKIRQSGKPLRSYIEARVTRGITTGLNEAFVVDRATRDRLIAEHKSSARLLKPYVRGRDVKRWGIEDSELFIIAFPFGFHDKLESYPAILRHLQKFASQLKRRGQCTSSRSGKNQGQHHWLELDNNPKVSYLQSFEMPKVVSTKVSIRPTFAFDADGYYLANTSYFFPATSSPLLLLGILNSSLFQAYAKKVFVEKQNGWYEVQPTGLEAFPIPLAPPEKQKAVERLVDRILAAKQRDAEANVSALEREIDQLVFALYGLTPQEIQIVQGSAK